MSTDMQQYSLENQKDAIAIYAERHDIAIVRSYEDAGRSGLRLKTRPALQRLLNDVISGRSAFDRILVYDVSRWGRFQDNDESAHYEYICKQAGVQVEYCAEEFANDGSVTAALMKTIKRAMAGEFSRDLSKRVFAGQARLASLGFHIGSMPGYGLRRHLISENGEPKMELAPGEYKNTHSERVILVPGPIEEVEVVRRIYDLFLNQHFSMKGIAEHLNSQSIPYLNNRDWSDWAIRDLLSNEKYIGTSVYARTSKKLGINYVRHPPDKWVRGLDAFQPIIPKQQFEQARRRLQVIARRYTYDENAMLDAMTALWCARGRLTNRIVDDSRYCPTTHTYKSRFGSLACAFERVGYRDTRRTGLHLQLRKKICREITAEIACRGGTVERLRGSCRMLINGEIMATIVLGYTPRGVNNNWFKFNYEGSRRPDILIVARIDEQANILDYFTLPFPFLTRTRYITTSGRNYRKLASFRSKTLTPFYAACGRSLLESR